MTIPIKRLIPLWAFTSLKNGLLDAMAYRFEFLSRVFGEAITHMGVQWILWYGLFKIEGHTTIAGQTYDQMLAYTMGSLLFSQIRGGDPDYEVAEMIRSGSLSNYLVRPISPVGYVYFETLGAKLLVLIFSLALGLLGALLQHLSISHLFLAIGLALLGNLIHFFLSVALSCVAFYWEEAYALLMVKNMAIQILCGELIPLFLFPEHILGFVMKLPFQLYVFAPTQIFLGRYSNQEILSCYLNGFLWLGLAYAIYVWAWSKGIKRYLALGG